MSYVCLAVNQNGAAAASDSMVSYSYFGRESHIHTKHTTKVYFADGNRILWCLAGATAYRQIQRCMDSHELTLEQRLEKVKKKACAFTIDFYRRSLKRQNGIITILYVSYLVPGNPVVGRLHIVNGKVMEDSRSGIPVFLEAGSNAARLTWAGRTPPYATPQQMGDRAVARVNEAIAYDNRQKQLDPKYIVRVGGQVKLRVLTYKCGTKNAASGV